MKILAINGGAKGSSWNICVDILLFAQSNGNDVMVATPDKKPHDLTIPYYKIGNNTIRQFNRVLTRIDGSDGFRNYLETYSLLKCIKRFGPDVVHLHTLHGYFVNLPILFRYFNRHKTKIIITCHDCWWFTGRCSHFFMNNCYKWETECHKCEYMPTYPKAILFDKSKKYFRKKLNLFRESSIVFVACVSRWLTNLCIRSPFFAGKEIITIYNGVNPDFYYPIKNTKREKGKILCVSSQWTKDKGIDFLIELAKRLDDYAFTVVGVMPNIKDMPNNIFAIGIVNSKNKLNELFNSHELFLNVSKQETFSLTNIEAQMSGTPVICFAQTGMKETIEPINSISIENYSSEEFIKAISSVRNKSLNHSQIRNFALQFNLGNMVSKYYELYLQHCTDSKIAE